LHWVAARGFTDVVKLLFANKADVNAKGTNDWTPLHDAAKKIHMV
jgi:ankyrin repeat protein